MSLSDYMYKCANQQLVFSQSRINAAHMKISRLKQDLREDIRIRVAVIVLEQGFQAICDVELKLTQVNYGAHKTENKSFLLSFLYRPKSPLPVWAYKNFKSFR